MFLELKRFKGYFFITKKRNNNNKRKTLHIAYIHTYQHKEDISISNAHLLLFFSNFFFFIFKDITYKKHNEIKENRRRA